MPRLFFTTLLLATLLASCAPRSLPAAPQPSILLEDCALVSSFGDQVDARCGTLTVPENRAEPAGRQIDLYIAVVPAVKRNPEPDPLFLLAGGPGQSAIETFPAIISFMSRINADRDIVLVDQRGTGKSNPLQCLNPEDESLSAEQALAQLKDCPTKLSTTADLRFYTTEIAMADLDAVRAALGYESINLYGASYGTRAALTYLRLFPEHVRTLTLDAVVDPGFIMYLDAGRDGQSSLEQFFGRCEADEACARAFPELRTELNGLLSRLEAQPAEVSIRHPRTNQPLNLTVTRQLVLNMIFSTLYLPELTATLPASIHTAYTEENYAPLVTQGFMADSGIYDGMFYAVACTEDAPLISAEQARQASAGSVFGNLTENFVSVCTTWPKGAVSADFRQPVVSDVPALILSGEADPITPPVHAQQVTDSLTNELHLIYAHMGHGNISSRCSMNILRDFLESASVAGLDSSCVAEVVPPPFFVNFNGPRP